MALTSTEEAQLRDLLTKKSSLDSLAANESAITANLGASSATLPEFPSATAIDDTDLMLLRQSTVDRSMTVAALFNKFFGSALVTVDVTSGNVTLTNEQAKAKVINVIGTPSAARQLIFPATVGQWTIKNSTNSNFTTEAKLSTSSGVLTYPNRSTIVYGDGNLIGNADTDKFALATGGINTISTAQTLPQKYPGSTVQVLGNTATIALTLPTPVAGIEIEIVNNSAFPITINRQGANTITTIDATSITATTLQPACKIVLLGKSGSEWLAIGGAGENPSNFAASGWTKLPNGIIMQWGAVGQNTGTTQTYALPRSFPNAPLSVVASKGSAISASNEFAVGVSITNTQITITNSNSGSVLQGITWIALGF